MIRLQIVLLLLCLVQFTSVAQKPQFIWTSEQNSARQDYAYFRNEFDIAAVPTQAVMHIYAFSRYSLWINGQFVNFGPIRSYPEHPYFDSLDLAKYLQKGKNIIAVKAFNNGMETFQLPAGPAAFVAWGEFADSDKTISLTTPGNWICRSAKGYHPLAPRFSFAKGPIEVFDSRLEPDNWQTAETDRVNWGNPVVLKNPPFGPLKERTIPLLTNTEITPKSTLCRVNLHTDEQLFTWNLLGNDLKHSSYGANPAAWLSTYIFSPTNQVVDAGLSWGTFWLNGIKVAIKADSVKPFRNNARLVLHKGWNSLTGRQTILWGSLDGMMAFPSKAGIELSVNRKKQDKEQIKIAGPFSKEQEKQAGLSEEHNFNPESTDLKWQIGSAMEPFANPPKELAWLDPKRTETNHWQRSHIDIPAFQDQAVVFDFGHMQLGRIFIEVDAPAGTLFDLTFSEDANDSLPTLYKRIQINAGARFIAQGGRQHFETYKPYGLRFLQVSVRKHSAPVQLIKTGLYSQLYPFEKLGSFACSDPLLNDIWEMGWRTIQACSEDAYNDTPFRERGHYAGDLFPEFAVTLATSGDPRLAKHTIRVITDMYKNTYEHHEETRHGDYPIINTLVAAWYVRMFKDKAFAQELYPRFAPYFMKWHKKQTPEGLYQPERLFFEWIQIDKTAALTSFQALMVAAFREMEQWALLLEKPEEAAIFESYASQTAQTIREKLWDSTEGNFIDGLKDGEILSTRFPSSSTFPSVWGIPTIEQEKALQAGLAESLIEIGPPENRKQLSTPYGGFYALAALYQQQNAALAEKYIIKHWSKMVYEANDLTWEDFNRDKHSTMSHAWSSSPTYYLSTQVLGVDLGFPGTLSADTIYIKPQSETLSWARGTVPHPSGNVDVEWRIVGSKLHLEYNAPRQIPVVVEPRGRLKNFELILSNHQNNNEHVR